MFLTPTFRGFFANYSALLHPELHDVFYNETFLDHAKSYWNAEYAKPQMMLFNIFTGETDDRDGWVVKTDGQAIERYHTDDLRFLVHWSAEVFEDYTELKKNMDGSDSLTFDRAFETLIKDVRARGIEIEISTDPLRDPVFINTLSSAHNYGGPAEYPAEAPRGEVYAAAA